MREQGLQQFGGDWTQQKLDVLAQYLKAYARALSKQRFDRLYIDAFAGTGYIEQRRDPRADLALIFSDEDELMQRERQQFLDGSPRIALRVDPPFSKYIFVEMHQGRASELQRLKLDFPDAARDIDIRCEDANAAIQGACQSWSHHMRGVLFLDPFGMQVDWSTLAAVAATKAIDVWILFPFSTNRLLTRDPDDIPTAWQARLTRMFGGDDWRAEFYKPHLVESLFSNTESVMQKDLTLERLGSYYMERLKTIFPVVAPNPRVLRNTRNSPLFQFFFAAANPGRGGEIALKIAKHILGKI